MDHGDESQRGVGVWHLTAWVDGGEGGDDVRHLRCRVVTTLDVAGDDRHTTTVVDADSACDELREWLAAFMAAR